MVSFLMITFVVMWLLKKKKSLLVRKKMLLISHVYISNLRSSYTNQDDIAPS